MSRMLLYPLIGIFFIVVGHTSYKIAKILEDPTSGAKITREIGRFFYFWAFLVIFAAALGAFWFQAPLLY